MMEKLENLLQSPSSSLEWNNDFCRYVSHIRFSVGALSQAWQEYGELKIGGEKHTSAP